MIERPTTPSQAEIDRAMIRARQLRARAFGDVFSQLAGALRTRAHAVRGVWRTSMSKGMFRLQPRLETARVPAVNPTQPCPTG